MTTTRQLLDLALQQVAAESYLHRHNFSDPSQVREALVFGNNYPEFIASGLTRLPLSEANRFASNLQILSHHANDATGFSATLTRLRSADGTLSPYTLSFRSTEFRPSPEGDRERDIFDAGGRNRPPSLGADVEISMSGYAFGQIAAMENYYRYLRAAVIPAGEKLNVTGYSLGGHLATVFTLLHPNDILGTYTFNGPGVGGVGTASTGTALQSAVQRLSGTFQEYLSSSLGNSLESLFLPNNPDTIYEYPQYWLARSRAQAAALSFGTPTTPSVGLPDGPFALITNVIGRADHNDKLLVANAGYHSANQVNVFIEDQPDWTGGGGVLGFSGDFGTTHSITLLVDSLALQSLFQELDSTLTREDIATYFSLASNQTGAGLVNVADATVEGNSLELALDGLRQFFLDPSVRFVPTPFSTQDRGFGDIQNRDAYFQNISSVRAIASSLIASGELAIVPLHGKSDSDLTAAMGQPGPLGKAIRLAVKNMTPFAVVGADLSQHSQQGELELYDPVTRQGSMTSGWIQDRIDAFQAYLLRNRSDADAARLSKPLPPTAYVLQSGDGPQFDDIVLAIGTGASSASDERMVVFGPGARFSDGRPLLGGRLNDTLYGMEGDDRLEGREGDDRLEGGFGIDTYALTSGSGSDSIFDADGHGRVLIDDTELAVGRQVGTNTYISEDGAHVLSVLEGNNTVVIDGRTKIVGFRNGDLGLRFEGLPDPPPPVEPEVEKYYIGGPLSNQLVEAGGLALHAFGSPFSDSYVGVDYDTSGESAAPLFNWRDVDYPLGFPEAANFLGKGGDDALAVFSMNGAQFHGGSGNDFIIANETTKLQAARDLPVLAGGSGGDRIEGSADAEFILGDYRTLAAYPGSYVDLDTFLVRWLPDGEMIGSYNASLGGSLSSAAIGEVIYLPSISAYVDLVIGPAPSPNEGTGFDDTIDGGAGDDIIAGGPGNDVIHGGEGDDWLGGDNQFDRPVGAPISFRVDSAGFGDLASRLGYTGNDYIDGGAGNDHILDREAGNVAPGATPVSMYSVLIGGAGEDTIVSEVRGAYIDGGDDNDTLFAYRSATVLGGTGDDTIDAVESWVDGGPGADTYQVHSHLLQSHDGSAALTIRDAGDPLSLDTILLSNLTWNGGAQWIAFDAGDPDNYPQDILDFIAAGGDPSANDGPGTVGVDVLSTTVTPYREGDDLVLCIREDAIEFTLLFGVDPILRVQDWFLGQDYQIEAITFEGDGVTWTPDDVNAMVADQEDDVPQLADLPGLTYAPFDFDLSAFGFDLGNLGDIADLGDPVGVADPQAEAAVRVEATTGGGEERGDPAALAISVPLMDAGRAEGARQDNAIDLQADLAASQSDIAREVEGFFARSQGESLRESAWLDQWVLGGHGGSRGDGGSDGRGPATESRESRVPDADDTPDAPPPVQENFAPDEVAGQYERMHAWLDAHPADQGSAFEARWSARSSLFASVGYGIGATARQDYLVSPNAGVGAPLRGLGEGLQPLALA
jgi:Ca2+-binding RTX toxin-like protein